MAHVSVQVGDTAGLSECPKCRAPLDRLIVGGVGDWRNTILCAECHFIQRGLHFDRQIVPLVAQQYGIPQERARHIEQTSQQEYEQIILKGGPVFPDLPPVVPVARWLARRLLAAGETL